MSLTKEITLLRFGWTIVPKDGSQRFGPVDDGPYVRHEDAQAELTQLRGNLSLAEDGLANYALEVERLKAGRENVQRINDNGAREIERLRAALAKAEQWRDYYRAQWMGPQAVPPVEPPAVEPEKPRDK